MARTARGRATREAFREGARRVFERDGYLSARLSDIASEAGRSPALLYQHYDGKASLLADLAVHFSDDLRSRLRSAGRGEADPVGGLRTTIRETWLHYRENLGVIVGITQAAMIDPDFAARWDQIHRDATDLVSRGIRRAQAEGYCPGLDPDIAASALTAMVEQVSLSRQYMRSGPESTDDQVIDTLSTLWAHAVYWKEPFPATEPPPAGPDRDGADPERPRPRHTVPTARGPRRAR